MESVDASALPRTIHAIRGATGLARGTGGGEVLKGCLGISLDSLAALMPVGGANFTVFLLMKQSAQPQTGK